ncbi:MAG: hypothetical protein V4699_01120 [Patescibacteria group bacterium]
MGKKTIVFIFLTVIFFSFARHQAGAAFDCLTLATSSAQRDKDYCQNELVQIEAQLKELLNKQAIQQKQTGTLKGDVDYLTSQINALKTKIKARALVIAQLKVNIAEKVKTINSLSEKIDREHESLAQLLRNTNEFDEETLLNLIISDNSISNFYSDLESYASIRKAVRASIDIINGIKTDTEVAKTDLEKKQDDETDAKAELESAQKTVAKSEADKQVLLAISKNKEAEYQKLATQKKIQADRIRSALFPLAGISQKIEFGTALQYANEAQTKTGIGPAFLLAILTQESNLGANVGQCYLTNKDTGAGVGKNTGTPFSNVMKPMGLPGRKGDIDDFLNITSALGLQWNLTAVSCPIGGYGYGGAMGPAQFIPSTWGGYARRLKTLLGHDANPWDPRDAFMASATLLSDKGAVGGSYTSERTASCNYYAGSGGCPIITKYSTQSQRDTTSYGNNVMKLKAKIQADIDLLQ